MFDQSFIEEQEVPLADTHKQRMTMVIYCIFSVSVTCVCVCVLPHGFGDVSKLHKVVLLQQLMCGHVTLRTEDPVNIMH